MRRSLSLDINTLSEYDSKKIFNEFGINVPPFTLAENPEEAVKFAERVGYPVVLKGNSWRITHKTERGLVKVNIKSPEELKGAFLAIKEVGGDELDGILVQRMIRGIREFIMGVAHDRTFGKVIMFGIGGVLSEAIRQVVFRAVPIDEEDAEEMVKGVSSSFLGHLRGEPPVKIAEITRMLLSLSKLAEELEVKEVDLNPVIIEDGIPYAADALIVL